MVGKAVSKSSRPQPRNEPPTQQPEPSAKSGMQGKNALLTIAINTVVGLFIFGVGKYIFDQTRGFPGEGPDKLSNEFVNLTLTTWNTRSLTFERFSYYRNLGYDILAITEFWRNAHKFTDGSVSFTHSVPQINGETNDPIFPDDIASGVGILLSPRAEQQYMRHGSPCERICWVRLKGPVTNIFVIAIYMPHRARVKPCQDDTMASLVTLLKSVPKRDCIVLMGDFNEQLPGNIPGLTGKWAFGEKSENANNLLDVMGMFNLFAANTQFQPKRNCSTATYTSCLEGSFGPEAGNFVGRKVEARYQGKVVKGTVESTKRSRNHRTWLVKFDDGFVTRCPKAKLKK